MRQGCQYPGQNHQYPGHNHQYPGQNHQYLVRIISTAACTVSGLVLDHEDADTDQVDYRVVILERRPMCIMCAAEKQQLACGVPQLW